MREIEDVLDSTVPGEHVAVIHGDSERVGVVNRWYWSCRCGAGSKRKDMTIAEAQRDFDDHKANRGGR